MREHYDAIIVGAGPAGIFAALELADAGRTNVLMVEKGRPIARRHCPAHQAACVGCPTCAIMTGWGGAGAFSDGKLTLTSEVGGWLSEYMPAESLADVLAYADQLWLRFGATSEVHGPDDATAASLCAEADAIGMRLTPMKIRHLGTDRSPQVLEAMRIHLEGVGVDVRTESRAHRLISQAGQIAGVELDDGSVVTSGSVIVAPGREGADWLAEQADALGIPVSNNAVDIGVRVECPASVMERLTTPLYEAKLTYRTPTFGDSVRTFCMNPNGEVTTESYGDVITVNGHSFAEAKTANTNFAVLVSQRFTEPFRDPIAYGRSIAKLANLLGGGILVQRYSDLKQGRRSTPQRIEDGDLAPTMKATPGDLSAVLPYRHMTDIVEFLEALDALAPGIAGSTTLMYGVEVKFYSSRIAVDGTLMTPVQGLYAIGDGAGVTRGLLQASASGVVAARSVLART